MSFAPEHKSAPGFSFVDGNFDAQYNIIKTLAVLFCIQPIGYEVLYDN